MTEAEAKRLAHSEYWDERYGEVGPDRQVHEWFRSYNDLEPFLTQYLFNVYSPEADPRIVHLGSGDSVRNYLHPAHMIVRQAKKRTDGPTRSFAPRLQESNMC